MIQVEFTQGTIDKLHHERFYYPHPMVQHKMEALYLRSQNISVQDVCRLVKISKKTFYNYLHQYLEGGIEGLKELNLYWPQSKLEEHRQSIEAYFKEHPVASTNEAVAAIEQLTSIRRSPTQVRAFIKRIGMKRRRVGILPAKADVEQQEDFITQELAPRLDEAAQGKRAMYFVDAAHFVMGAFIGFLWSFVRVWIKAPSGRQRFNVLGALNAITHDVVTVVNDTYITALSVCELLHQIAALHIQVPITLVLDNARYQRCAIVETLAKELNIELLYLPPYSPNLNLIERLWKFVKKQCLYSKYYHDFSSFKETIYDCITNAHRQHKQELDSLLTLRFQTFKK